MFPNMPNNDKNMRIISNKIILKNNSVKTQDYC